MLYTHINLGMLYLSEKLHHLTITSCNSLCSVVQTNCHAVRLSKIDDTENCRCRLGRTQPWMNFGPPKAPPRAGMAVGPSRILIYWLWNAKNTTSSKRERFEKIQSNKPFLLNIAHEAICWRERSCFSKKIQKKKWGIWQPFHCTRRIMFTKALVK